MHPAGTSTTAKAGDAGGQPRGAHLAEDGDGDYANGDDEDGDHAEAVSGQNLNTSPNEKTG